jgi:TldD protein
VDDEGHPSEETLLVENGVLRSYIHDRISAKHYGVEPTGSGRRESFKHYPMPRMRNTYMKNGPHTFDEIIANVKYGIVAEQFTNGQVNIGPGDFTFYVKSGSLIEDGKITGLIKDVNIIGNGPEVLSRVTMVANDMKMAEGGWTCGKNGQSVPVSMGLPSVLVSSITVGGRG